VLYALETAGIVDKTDAEYQRVDKQLITMRREGILPYSFIADGTRWQRKPSTWDNAADYVERVSRGYRRDLWQSQDVRIEVWLEKDALADLMEPITRRWDVPLMVSRGLSSSTFLHAAGEVAAEAWDEFEAITFVYALYDYDAGGERAFRAIEHDLPEFADHAPVFCQRLALTDEQVTASKLPTRPAKTDDPEAATWGGKPCVELDALSPDRLTRLVEDAIVRHVDRHAWEVQEEVERGEREQLAELVGLLD